MSIKGTSDPHSWEAIYQAGDAGWDIGKAAPPFVTLTNENPAWLKKGKMICFGAGNGHDGAHFAQTGFDVCAVDFAPSAIKSIEKYAQKTPRLNPLQADILNLPDDLNNSYDYVLEHTCFCAIPPTKRSSYVDAAYKVLKPKAYLFGLFYRFDPIDDNGPPFAVSENEIRDLFANKFEILDIQTPQNSHGKRQNRERLIIMKVKK